ncbi:MAG: hypothetical protein ACJ75R_00315 [Solirubrobacterales bacterium]
MAYETPHQQLRRQRIERLIGLAAPVFDLVLAVGDRLSRIVGPEDDYIPIRAPSDAFELGPGRRHDGTTA